MFEFNKIIYTTQTLMTILNNDIGVGSWMVAKEDEAVVIPAFKQFLIDLNKSVEESKGQTRPTF
jgi:hypothetical protein